MLNTIDIASKIKNILHERFGIETAELNDDTTLRELGVDSLHLVEIMLDIETELHIRIEDLSLSPNPSLGEIGAVISKSLVAGA
jgi:acyl carrier protein